MEEIDIKNGFLDEAIELIDDCEEALEKLNSLEQSTDLIDRVFRDLHTVKGSAGVVGFKGLSVFVHKVEDVVNSYRNQGYVPEQSLSILVEANDWIAHWLENLKEDHSYSPNSHEAEEHLDLIVIKENIEIPKIASNDDVKAFELFENEASEPENQQTVLIVDDEPGMLKVIASYISDIPINVITASSGKEGLELYKNHNVDLIISDLKMPEMNGVDFIRQIRKIDEKVEVIFLTAHADKNSMEQFMKLRTFAFIDKAESHIEITNTVINGLRSKRTSDAVAIITKLNFEIYLDFNLLKNGKDVTERIEKKLEKVARLSSVISDPELILNTDLNEYAS